MKVGVSLKRLGQFSMIVSCLSVAACNSIDNALYQEQTLSSLEQVENRIIERIEALESQQATNDNTQSIASLREEVSSLSSEVSKSNKILKDLVASREVRPQIIEQRPNNPIVVTSNGDYVLGALERVTIEAIKQNFDARVDTGAETSSIHAMDIEIFERNGEDWVRFHIVDDEMESTDDNWIEAPIVRFVNIRHASIDKPQRRAVIKLWTRLGDLRGQNEFTLADRSQMAHPVLLGREFIRDVAVVDVSREFLQTERE